MLPFPPPPLPSDLILKAYRFFFFLFHFAVFPQLQNKLRIREWDGQTHNIISSTGIADHLTLLRLFFLSYTRQQIWNFLYATLRHSRLIDKKILFHEIRMEEKENLELEARRKNQKKKKKDNWRWTSRGKKAKKMWTKKPVNRRSHVTSWQRSFFRYTNKEKNT